ncbi:transposase-like protein [Deinococcus metalli]|uniref:Transposase-like protein n=1 Tax=Deinococcus metalli TaxID=1141878 RepID=A0A7W8NPW9_9DEIO|nr:IS1 family transposase [Deinococcus metalli]MBB5378394.1 transposase-like protein [Deinococcus metalli]
MNAPPCTACGGVYTVKNGHAHTGRQRYLCRVCGHQFTIHPPHHRISAETEELVDRLLSERISHRGICRVTGVSRSWFRRHLMKLHGIVQHGFELVDDSAKKQ